MESNYNIDKTKKASLRIEPNYSCQMLEASTIDMYAVPYNVYNINCFYDYANPMEFLNVLTNYAAQKSIDLVLDNIGKNIIGIKHLGKVVAQYSIARKHIDIESDFLYSDMELRYGNKINTFSVLKYILKAISVSEYLNDLRKIEHPEFAILNIRNSTKLWIPMFNSLRPPRNQYVVEFYDRIVDINFTAVFDFDNKTLSFENYRWTEGELYYSGSEPLTVDEIDRNIEFYTGLKNRIEYIHVYLTNIERKLCK